MTESATMSVGLPSDILHLICAELCQREDFLSLFDCAVSSPMLAAIAVPHLYRIAHKSPVRDGPSENLPFADQELLVQKWSILWRSIILSSFGDTLFPYCRFLRALDLREFTNLLEEDKFKGRIAKNFFSGKLAQFQLYQHSTGRASTLRRTQRLDNDAIVDAVGEVLTRQTPVLEQISGPVLATTLTDALKRWIPRLPHLRSLELWDGVGLGDDEIQQLVCAHCPNFQALRIYRWLDPLSDKKLSAFLCSLPQHSLQSFEILSQAGIGTETCIALNRHSKSLKNLQLNISGDSLQALALLRCTAIESLKIGDITFSNDLEHTSRESFVEVVGWLKGCERLRVLTVDRLVSASKLLTPVLRDSNISLDSLSVDDYLVRDGAEFHQALGQQKKLTSLVLSGDSENATRDDLDSLLVALCELKELRYLTLTGVSEYFTDYHITSIVQNLPHLESFYVGGYGVTDQIWGHISRLKHLRNITINALSSFTADGLAGFIHDLGADNDMLTISVDNADPNSQLSEDQLQWIREELYRKTGGRFEYTLSREDDVSEFEGESD